MKRNLIGALGLVGAMMLPGLVQAQSFIPDTRCTVVLASKPSRKEAIADVKLRWNDRDTVIYRSQNGWYAITWKIIPKATSASHLQRLKTRGEVPADALCSSGKSYLEQVGRYAAERPMAEPVPGSARVASGPSSSDDTGGRTPLMPGRNNSAGSRVPQASDDGGVARTPNRAPRASDDGGSLNKPKPAPRSSDDGGGYNSAPKPAPRGPDSSDDMGGLNPAPDRRAPTGRAPVAGSKDDDGGRQFAGVPRRTPERAEPPRRNGDGPKPDFSRRKSTGTGFVVSRGGHILTNEHVIDNCGAVKVKGKQAEVIAANAEWDLALIKVSPSDVATVAEFAPSPARLNSDVTVVGFPLTGLLSGLNVTRGAVSSEKGLRGDDRRMQISAPVQPGNSGGPVVDRTGAIVGVVVSKLNAKSLADRSGDIAQNVNFAIRGRLAKEFMTSNNVLPLLKQGQATMNPEDIARQTSSFTVLVSCY
ncbi:trypsin-like peptidase domain-containing protein [Rhodobacteraceae bacterium D3-12]|nr:trypsin-like peptidase domain-containing protein [Rhodobacteraceae bacterium D3-12]